MHIEPVSGAMDAFVSHGAAAGLAPGEKRTKKVLVEKSFVDDKGYLGA